jgi:hypothetical protein
MHKITVTKEDRPELVELAFKHDRTRRETTCRVIFNEDAIANGVARCHPADSFVKSDGRKLALGNALRTSGFTKDQRTEIWDQYFESVNLNYRKEDE